MKYSQMSAQQRKALLDDPDNYPMYLSFRNKVGLITRPQVAFLLDNGVDFDVDDRLAAEVLGEAVVRTAAAERQEQQQLQRIRAETEEEMTPARRRHLHMLILGMAALFARAFIALLGLLLRVLRLFPALRDFLFAIPAALASLIPAVMDLARRVAGRTRRPGDRE